MPTANDSPLDPNFTKERSFECASIDRVFRLSRSNIVTRDELVCKEARCDPDGDQVSVCTGVGDGGIIWSITVLSGRAVLVKEEEEDDDDEVEVSPDSELLIWITFELPQDATRGRYGCVEYIMLPLPCAIELRHDCTGRPSFVSFPPAGILP